MHLYSFNQYLGLEELNERTNSSKISEISDAIKNNLDPFDSIAGGECHDIALIAYMFAKNSDFLKNPVIKWTNGHAWVEGTFNQESVIFDIVAVNQKYLGEPFKEAKANANYPEDAMKTDNVKKYLRDNPLCGIDAESAEAGTEELEFLNDLL